MPLLGWPWASSWGARRRLPASSVEHRGAMLQRVFARAVVAVDGTGRVAEKVLHRARDPRRGVLLQLGQRYQYVRLLEPLVHVEARINVASPGHRKPAVARKRPAIARVLERHPVIARRLDQAQVPVGFEQRLFDRLVPIQVLDDDDPPSPASARIAHSAASEFGCVWYVS